MIFPIQDTSEVVEDEANTKSEDVGDSPPSHRTKITIDIPTVSKVSSVAKTAKAAKKFKRKGFVPNSCKTTTMDHSRALGILGFNSARALDKSSFNPKAVLDKAHFNKTMAIMKKKDEETEVDKNKFKQIQYSVRRKELSHDDQIRVIHEAYQFLLKKYNLGQNQTACEDIVSPFMELEMDDQTRKFQDDDGNEGMYVFCNF